MFTNSLISFALEREDEVQEGGARFTILVLSAPHRLAPLYRCLLPIRAIIALHSWQGRHVMRILREVEGFIEVAEFRPTIARGRRRTRCLPVGRVVDKLVVCSWSCAVKLMVDARQCW
jgi:hypothetical protein